jgi:omega-6 fatty acid desaturase (delta-12 desaturase)
MTMNTGAHPRPEIRSDGTRAGLLAISSQYGQAQTRRSVIQLLLTASLWLGSYAVGITLMQHSALLGTIAAIVAAAFAMRLFMIQHDCGHRSFFRSHRANDLLGFWLGILTMTPYRCWRRFHAQHHSNSGNLDRRGYGDIYTLTTSEYEGLSPRERLAYRLYRNPLVLFVIGPPLLFILRQRTTYKIPREWKVERRSVHLTNLGIAGLLAGICLVCDPLPALGFHLLTSSFAAIAGVWLFYVQHQFPDTYWKRHGKWESWRASMEGASYYELPAALRWLTANIGLHHIHHLDARVPNYRLYECFKRHPEFANPPRLGLRESLACLRLRLWDDQANRMVPFPATSC